MVCVLREWFSRYSLTIPRWLLTSTIRRSKTGKLHHFPGRNLRKRESLNPAHLAREIDQVQQQLTALSKRATLELEAAQYKPLPDITKGLKLRQAS